jgi:predicted Zn-dependent protease
MIENRTRRHFLQAASGLLIPGISMADTGLVTAEQQEKLMADHFWRVFMQGNYENGGAKYIPNDDATFNRAMRSIAEPLFATSSRSALDWRIGTADIDAINAFTVGGGVICMLRGLVHACDSEVELASVIAHEVGHVEHRHTIERMMTNVLFRSIDHRLLESESEAVRNSIVAKQFELVAPEILYAAYERLKEHEADAYSVRALARTGYDMRLAHSFSEKLLALRPGKVTLQSCLMTSHPDTRERIARIKGLSKRYGKQRSRPDSDAFKYLKSVA